LVVVNKSQKLHIMTNKIKLQIEKYISKNLIENYSENKDIFEQLTIEVPVDRNHGEYACNIALRCAKLFRRSPVEIAKDFVKLFESDLENASLQNIIAKFEVKPPGFINIFLTKQAFSSILADIIDQKENYGCSGLGEGKKIQLEFVSANPTGPLSVAHARQAVVGDVLAKILSKLGFDVCKEFYVNDEGNQIYLLGESINARAIELLGGSAEIPENGYQGDYIKDMAKIFIEDNKIDNIEKLQSVDAKSFQDFGAGYLLDIIKNELKDFGVCFDNWAYQSKIAPEAKVAEVLNELKVKEFLYEKDNALWFESTRFGDDKDRVVRKSDGSYTYLSPDIVYHKDKIDRGFDILINIWGPDHHGYIPRIKAAVKALGKDSESLNVLIVQLSTLYKDGKVIPMSTRKGKYTTLREVINEVGVDASRFFFLMRHIKAHLDFDLDLAKKETQENPVYYIQYAHARIYSIKQKAKDANLVMKVDNFLDLNQPEEIDLIKILGNYPDILEVCYKQLDPYAIVSYLQELATCFHRFYDKHKVLLDDNPTLSKQRLALVYALQIVLANGLDILGVGIPDKM